jgi:predicted PurR-regulated permease PerM
MILEAIILAVITLIVLLIFDIPYALLVSFLVAITNVIPFFGPFIGEIPSAFIIFVAAPEKCLLFIIIIFILQQIEGNIIAPKVLGSSTGISSLGVLVAIIIMGAYFGIVGMVVGGPIFAMIVTVCNEILESNLRKKGLPTETEDYYPSYSLVDPHEHREKLFNRIVNSISALFKKLFSAFKKKDKKQSKHNGSQDGTKS